MRRLGLFSCSLLFACSTTRPAPDDSVGDLARRVRRYVDSAIQRRVFPGCQIIVARRAAILLDGAYGRESYERSSRKITPATRYDLASLTKIVATTGVAMAFHTQGRLDLESRASDLVPEFRGGQRDRITLRLLLAHSSGMCGWKPLYKEAPTRRAMIDKVLAEPLAYEPGRSMDYSDLGFILLGLCLERLGGESLARLAARLVFEPLGMRATSFGPLPEGVPVAPTEWVQSRGGTIRGRVHDENAAALDGIAGHAGLFSTARDVARFMRCLLARGELDGVRLFSPQTVDLFTRRANLVIDSSRALGFDTPHAKSSSGRWMSKRAFGHTGFTGTSAWADPSRDLVIVCLTNRVHPTRANKQIHSFRRGLHDLVIESLEGGRGEPVLQST